MSLLTYKIRKSGESEHFRSLLTNYVPTTNVRSAERKVLVITWIKLDHASHSFSIVTPCTCNKLSLDVTSTKSIPVFRKRLKTYLFNMAYKYLMLIIIIIMTIIINNNNNNNKVIIYMVP